MFEFEFKQIVYALRAENPTDASRAFLLTGPVRGVGCSFVSANLAAHMASEIRGDVCLIDFDLQSPSLHEPFQLDRQGGLTDYLFDGKELSTLWKSTAIPNFHLLSTGRSVEETTGMIPQEVIDRLMETVRKQFHYIFIDSAPCSISPYTFTVASKVDGIIFVIEAEKIRRESARKMIERFESCGGAVQGIVVNRKKHYIPEWIYKRL